MLGLESRTVAIVAHDDEWARQFEAEARELTQLLGEAGIQATIQHIGSTAISGLGAKPIIDIAIGVHDEALVGRTLGVMKAAGRDYVKAANQPGMLFMAKGNPRTFHYHLVYLNGRAWDRLVLFRDQPRRHLGVAREYAQPQRDL